MSASSAIHRVPDNVFVEICRELLGRPRAASRTVASLAVAARRFHEPALNCLWRSIPDIAVLFCTLDEKVCLRRKVEGRWQFGFEGIPHERQLERFLAYAQRVREIDCEINLSARARSSSAVPEAYDTLASILGTRVLLPNVTRISFKRSENVAMEVFRSFHILFGPKLRLLRIFSHDGPYAGSHPEPYTEKDEAAFVQMLQKLADVRPQLQKMYFLIRPSSDAMKTAVDAAVCRLDSLVSLKIAHCDLPLTPAAFSHLAKLPSLHYLDLTVDGSYTAWADSLGSLSRAASDPMGTSFPVLRQLHVTAPTFALSTELLRFVTSPSFARLSVTAAGAVPRDELRPLFIAIGGLPGAKTITQFYVNAATVLPADSPTGATPTTDEDCAPRPIGRPTLEPLLVMSGLEDVMLVIACPFDIDDPLLDEIGQSWPRLWRFRLGDFERGWGLVTESDYGEGDVYPGDEATAPAVLSDAELAIKAKYAKAWRPPRATLFGLLAFAESCPYIDVIQIELDASLKSIQKEHLEKRPMLGALWRPRNKRPVLSGLSVGLSPIDDPYAVAAFLSDWISRVDDLNDGWLDMIDGYEEVNDDDDDADFDEQDDDVPWSTLAQVYRRRWRMVKRLIPKFARVRTQERRWKQKMNTLPNILMRVEEWHYDEEDGDSDSDMGFV